MGCTRVKLQGYLVLGMILALAPELCPQTTPSPAEKSWANKNWTQWTREDCISILLLPPWTGYGSRGDSRTSSIPVFYSTHFSIHWLSSRPVQQALIRLKQIDNQYEEMADAEKASFDAWALGEFPPPGGDRVMVRVDERSFLSPLAGFGGLPYDALLVLGDGRIVLPQEIRRQPAPQGQPSGRMWVHQQIDVFFPRVVDGAALLKAGDTKVTVVVGRRSGASFQVAARAEFKVADMIYNGKLEY